jgi:ribonuclease HI
MNNIFDTFKVVVYADGACLNNGSKNSKGGWSFIIRFDNGRKEIHSAGYSEMTTNNRMELISVIKALEEIKQKWPDLGIPIIVFSDSQYVVKGSSDWMLKWEKNGWKRGKSVNKNGKKLNPSAEVSNLDLWKKMFEFVNEIHPSFLWVKGHAGNKYNELCDSLASVAIDTQSSYRKIFRMSDN